MKLFKKYKNIIKFTQALVTVASTQISFAALASSSSVVYQRSLEQSILTIELPAFAVPGFEIHWNSKTRWQSVLESKLLVVRVGKDPAAITKSICPKQMEKVTQLES